MPDEVGDRALETQGQRARHSAALPDLLIAATAERHGVTVLLYDHEYDLVGVAR